MKKALIIFVRKPEPGKVKTRLAATIGIEKALQVYNELLQHTFEISKEADASKFIYYSNEIEKDDLWNAEGFLKRVQSNTDLGHKMKNSFTELFAERYEKVIIIGSDCFELTTALIQEAFALLDKTDIVIGPAKDGGYYLLGMKKLHRFIFENKKWSTATVYVDTIRDLDVNHLSFSTLPVLTDVDTEEDWLLSKKNIV